MSEVAIYRLRVELTRAPYEDGEGVWRVIEIRGNQTMDQLHGAIFKAFTRWEDHLYSFFMSSDRRDKSKEYVSPFFFEEDEEREGLPQDAASVRLDSLGLTTGSTFDYMFDYGDDWEHKLEVLGLSDEDPSHRYPRVAGRHGASPPQYPESDEAYDDEPDEPPEEDDGPRGRVLPFPRTRSE
jgi:hypothetical protein